MADDEQPKDETDESPVTCIVRVVDQAHTRITFAGETLEYGDEGEVLKSTMRNGVPHGAYERVDGCQAMVEDEGRGRSRENRDDDTPVRPCTNDAKSGEYCGVHS